MGINPRSRGVDLVHRGKELGHTIGITRLHVKGMILESGVISGWRERDL